MRIFSLLPARSTAVLAVDAAVSAAVYVGSLYLLLGRSARPYLEDSHGWMRVGPAVFCVLAGLYFNDLYTAVRAPSRVALVLELTHALGVSLVLQTLLAYISNAVALPRRVVLLAAFLCFPALFLWRIAYSGFLWKLFGQQNVVLVGSGPLAQDLAQVTSERPERGFRVVGYVGEPAAQTLMRVPCLGPFERLPAIVEDCKPDRVVVACSDRREGGLPIEELLVLRERGVAIEEGARLYEILRSRICAQEFLPAHYIFDQTLVHRPGSLALQAIYINLAALAGLMVLSPVLLILAAAVKISTGESVFDPMMCVGYRGIPFPLRRFRTTRVAPDSTRLVRTRLGKFLRASRLDLLPALLNLWRGEMSLVGPRPCRPEISQELARYIPFFQQRYTMKPGLTGWGQINMDDRMRPADALTALEYDLYYLRNMSLSLDAYILLYQVRKALSFSS